MNNELTLSDLAAITAEHQGKGMNARIVVTYDGGETFYPAAKALLLDEDEIIIEVDSSHEAGTKSPAVSAN